MTGVGDNLWAIHAFQKKSTKGITGIDAGDFSRVRNADFRRISVERLMTMINKLGSRVVFEVKVRPISRASIQHTTQTLYA